MAEDVAEPGIGAGPEGGAHSFKRKETEPTGPGYSGKWRRYRVQSGHELGQHEKRRPIAGKGI